MNDSTRTDAALRDGARGDGAAERCTRTTTTTPSVVELTDAQLDQAAGGLVVPAIIAVLTSPLLPAIQKDGLTPDQAQQVAAGNPLPRPR